MDALTASAPAQPLAIGEISASRIAVLQQTILDIACPIDQIGGILELSLVGEVRVH